MKKLTVLFLLALFAALPVAADCTYGIDQIGQETEPCPPCPFVAVGSQHTVVFWMFDDGSKLLLDYQAFQNCDGESYESPVGSTRPYCPLGPDNPCMARDIVGS